MEPGLLGQMGDDFVEMHVVASAGRFGFLKWLGLSQDLPAGAEASISQKIIPM